MNISQVLPFIEHIHSFAYWFAFFAALLETFVGLGLIVPGTTIIIFLGSLATEGYFKIYDLLIFVVFGAVIGNFINYFLGKKLGPKLKAGKIPFIKPSLLEKATKFFHKHGGKSIFIGRFIPSLRETVPLIAGISNMNKGKFFFWNFLGSLAWGIFATFSGYYFNHYLKISKLLLTRSGIFILFIILLVIVLNYFKKAIIKKGALSFRVIKSLIKSVNNAISTNEYVEKLIKKYPKAYKVFSKRFDRTSFGGLPLTCFTLIIIYFLGIFGGLIEDVLSSDIITFADLRIENLLTYFRHDLYSRIFLWITLLGKLEIVCLILLITVIILWSGKKNEYIWTMIFGIAGSTTFSYLGKLAFHRPRPSVALYLEKSYSFPSGHATVSIMLYGFICYIFIKNSENWKNKVNVFFITLILIGMIGFSRLYLGVHYLSDVLGGYLLGTIWLVTSIALTEYSLYKEKTTKNNLILKNSLIYPLIGTFFLIYFIFAYNYKPKLIFEKPLEIVTTTNPLTIFNNENMKFTESILGLRQEPISLIIIAKNDFQFVDAFHKAGWYLADEVNLISFLNTIKDGILNIPYPTAPMTPDFWSANVNNFGFEKPTIENSVKKRHHSRFWKTPYKMINGNSIYIGTVSLDKNSKWGITHQIDPNIDGERELLFSDLKNNNLIEKVSIIQFTEPTLGKNFLGDPFFTDGKTITLEIK